MPSGQLWTAVESQQSPAVVLVVSAVSLLLLAVLLVLDIRYIRQSKRLATTLGLPQGQWLRPAKTLVFDPAIELLAIGLLLADDLVQNWEHLAVGIVGAVVGFAVGRYRYRIQYVRAIPEHKAIVFVRSRAEYVALAILMLVSIASQQHEIPVVGPLTLLVTLGLATVVFEAIGRAWFSYRRYRQDLAGT